MIKTGVSTIPAFSNAQRSFHSSGPGMYSPSSAIFFSPVSCSLLQFLSDRAPFRLAMPFPERALGPAQVPPPFAGTDQNAFLDRSHGQLLADVAASSNRTPVGSSKSA